MAQPMMSKEFTVIYDGSTVGYATSFDLTINKESIDITILASDGWKNFVMGDKDWSVSFDGLVTRTTGDGSRGYDYIVNNLITSDASVVIAIKPTIASNKYLTGVGFLENVNMTGSAGAVATFSGSVRGTGVLTQTTV